MQHIHGVPRVLKSIRYAFGKADIVFDERDPHLDNPESESFMQGSQVRLETSTGGGHPHVILFWDLWEKVPHPREEYMSTFKTTRRVAVGLVAAAAATFTLQAQAGGHGIDLTGKTVEWIIPFSETGGSA